MSTPNLYLMPKKTIALIIPEQYSTVTTSIQKLLPLCADWLQHRSHRSWLKQGSNADILNFYRARIEREIAIVIYLLRPDGRLAPPTRPKAGLTCAKKQK
jgi:hypothetical protein